MKNKTLYKKLQLSKTTVTNLANFEMDALKGGVTLACSDWFTRCGLTCKPICP